MPDTQFSSPWPRPMAEVREALLRVFASGDWGRYHGQETEQLTAQLRQRHAGRQVRLCSSGTIAVELALRGLGVVAGDEVILSAYDFPGNFRAIEAIGAIPVLVDVAAGHWTMPADQLVGAASDRTRAVIVSHLHGDLAPMSELMQAAQQLNLLVVEDACQAIGATEDGRAAGTWGDAAVLSFGGSKLVTCGRGGAVLSDDPQVMQRIRIHAERGNDAFPLSELQAAVLRCQLDQLADDHRKRADGARQLRRLISDSKHLGVVAPRPASDPAYYKLGLWWQGDVRCDADRDTFLQRCWQANLPVDRGFRGFTQRSPRRCRVAGDGKLTHADAAIARTLLIHHPVLLADPTVIDQLAATLLACLETD